MLEKKYCFTVYSIICLITSLVLVSCRKPELHKETRLLMGTLVSVEIAADSPQVVDGIMPKIWAEAERLEVIFSRYLPDSEISRINREAARHPVTVSDEMMTVLSRAEEISRLTDGAFDITIGPIMEIWGFFPERKGRVPSDEEIEEALSRLGWRAVELDRDRRTVRFSDPGVEIDLGGLAKGYIVDRLVSLLVEEGIESALVNAGGDIYCLGSSPGGRYWRIGMEHPRNDKEMVTVLNLKDRAVATSGDYRNYFIRRRLRYSHIIDPRTGRPSRSGVVETSVLAPDCLTADALATALFITGAEAGIELLNTIEGVDGIIVTEEEDEVTMHSSGLKL